MMGQGALIMGLKHPTMKVLLSLPKDKDQNQGVSLPASTQVLLVIVVEHRVFFKTADAQIAGETTAVGDQTQLIKIQIHKDGAMAHSLDPDRFESVQLFVKHHDDGQTTPSSTGCSSTSSIKLSPGRARCPISLARPLTWRL